MAYVKNFIKKSECLVLHPDPVYMMCLWKPHTDRDITDF